MKFPVPESIPKLAISRNTQVACRWAIACIAALMVLGFVGVTFGTIGVLVVMFIMLMAFAFWPRKDEE